jgi:outer membrane protein OmpA-like peptidoglycan-associated protein
MRVPATVLALLLATVASGGAQSSGAFEITGFGRQTFFDDTLGLEDKIGGGGSLAIFFVKNLALEAEAAHTSTDGPLGISVTNTPVRGRLTYHIPLGGNATSIRLGAGYVRDMYGDALDADEDGVTGVLGLRLGLSEKLGAKLDGTIDYVPSPEGDADSYMNLGVQAGLSLLLGNSYDKDKDKVKNKADQCPETPAGQTVDASGCAESQRDTDADKVNDAADRCPNTPGGEAVDGSGCSAGQKDADKDRVTDTADRCASTPAGEPVDPNGCSEGQKDDDKDGVVNPGDRCPNTPEGETPDPYGCVLSQQDKDADKVIDSADECPNSLAGESVDPRGCGRDTDGDKIADAKDICPATPNGQAVDENGCPILFQRGERSVTLQGVTFATGKATLTPESEAVLKDAAQQLAANPEIRVQVSGYTDNTGSRATNVRISKDRAAAVERFLEANGVSPAQVTSKGFGPDKPVASNKTAEGRAKNRRVELTRTN